MLRFVSAPTLSAMSTPRWSIISPVVGLTSSISADAALHFGDEMRDHLEMAGTAPLASAASDEMTLVIVSLIGPAILLAFAGCLFLARASDRRVPRMVPWLSLILALCLLLIMVMSLGGIDIPGLDAIMLAAFLGFGLLFAFAVLRLIGGAKGDPGGPPQQQ